MAKPRKGSSRPSCARSSVQIIDREVFKKTLVELSFNCEGLVHRKVWPLRGWIPAVRPYVCVIPSNRTATSLSGSKFS